MLKRINRFLGAVLIILVVLLLYRSSQRDDTKDKVEPATIEAITGSELKRVKLTAKAAERLGIETEEVEEEWVSTTRRLQKVIPYSSVLYDLDGKTWVYTRGQPLTFIRHSIVVDFIDDDDVYLSDGPPVETEVVTVGAAELYGVETGVGK